MRQHVREPGARAPFLDVLGAVIAGLAPSWAYPSGRKTAPKKERIAAVHAWWLKWLPHVQPGHETCTCWGCGYHGVAIERSHISMKAKGAGNSPRNFLLLCTGCHRWDYEDMAPVSEAVAAVFAGMRAAKTRTPLSLRLADAFAGAPLYLEDCTGGRTW